MADDTFCVLPWVHAATLTDGSVQLCCVSGGGSGVNLNEQTLADYWNSDYVKDARRRMLAGRKVKACSRCYVQEALGRRSHRIVENEVWQARLGADTIHELTAQTAADGSLLGSTHWNSSSSFCQGCRLIGIVLREEARPGTMSRVNRC